MLIGMVYYPITLIWHDMTWYDSINLSIFWICCMQHTSDNVIFNVFSIDALSGSVCCFSPGLKQRAASFADSVLVPLAQFFQARWHMAEPSRDTVGIHGIPMGYLWDTYGIPMGYLWDTYGIPMGYLWDTFDDLRFQLLVWLQQLAQALAPASRGHQEGDCSHCNWWHIDEILMTYWWPIDIYWWHIDDMLITLTQDHNGL